MVPFYRWGNGERKPWKAHQRSRQELYILVLGLLLLLEESWENHFLSLRQSLFTAFHKLSVLRVHYFFKNESYSCIWLEFKPSKRYKIRQSSVWPFLLSPSFFLERWQFYLSKKKLCVCVCKTNGNILCWILPFFLS